MRWMLVVWRLHTGPHPQTDDDMTNQTLRALILDDDPWIGELLRARLESAIPNLRAEYRTAPDCDGRFDAYFVDNQFCGTALATELVHEIRRDQPEALIVVFSGKLERQDLINLVRADCDLVFEKGNQRGIDSMIREVQRMLHAPRLASRRWFRRGGTIRALADLIYQLNNKLVDGTPHQQQHPTEAESK